MPVREPFESLASKIRDFNNAKASQVILLIPRSEVIQKEMILSGKTKESLESTLVQLLPYAPREMAYSIALNPSDESTRGLLYAIPEQKIKEILTFLEKIGLSVDEIVSEDQAIFWLFKHKASAGPIVILDQTPQRLLFLSIKENALLLSKVFPPEEDLKNVLQEISYSLLEAGIKPTKVISSNLSKDNELSKLLEIPSEQFEPESLRETIIPTVFSGAKLWGTDKTISLLTNEQKIEKRNQKQRKLLNEILMAFGAFLVSFSLLIGSHLFLLDQKRILLEKKNQKILSDVMQVRRMTEFLALLHRAQASKQRLLGLLKNMAERVPGSIRLRELQLGSNSITFRGESQSHAFLTETVQVFEKMEGVKDVKLEYARLRKRLNEDFFDFEVTARWLD
jgi:Tfp pilus assembly protein PilN